MKNDYRQKIVSWIKKHPIWSGVIGLFIVTIILSALGGGSSTPAPTPAPVQTQASAPASSTTPTLSKDDAQEQLDDLMALSKKGGLVSSYDFSDSEDVVYVTDVWYTQTVQFKKDFMAKIAMLKKAATGYDHFEVRDANSNEKVGEVTAFSGSLEVYK